MTDPTTNAGEPNDYAKELTNAALSACLESYTQGETCAYRAELKEAARRLAALTPAPAQPDPPTAAGVEPVAWRAIYTQADGTPGVYVTSDRELAVENDATGTPQPLYATPPTLTDAQCDAIWKSLIESTNFLHADDWRVLIRAAAAGAG